MKVWSAWKCVIRTSLTSWTLADTRLTNAGMGAPQSTSTPPSTR